MFMRAYGFEAYTYVCSVAQYMGSSSAGGGSSSAMQQIKYTRSIQKQWAYFQLSGGCWEALGEKEQV
jgi:hypothetical protein